MLLLVAVVLREEEEEVIPTTKFLYPILCSTFQVRNKKVNNLKKFKVNGCFFTHHVLSAHTRWRYSLDYCSALPRRMQIPLAVVAFLL